MLAVAVSPAKHMAAFASQQQLSRQMEGSPLPIGLVDLASGLVVAVSEAALALGGLRADQVLGHPMSDRIHPNFRAGVTATMQAMADGSVDLFRARLPIPSLDRSRWVIAWFRQLELDGRRYALFELADDSLPSGGPLAPYLGRESLPMALGLLDDSGVLTRMSSSITKILGIEPDVIVGKELAELVHQDEAERVRQAIKHAGGDMAAGVRVRLRNAAREWMPVYLVITPLHGPCGLHGVLVRPASEHDDRNDSRFADLQQHLWNIAGEIEAAGIAIGIGAVAGPKLPDRATMTARQWEVLGRLLHGERVPTIAKEMFLSQSTVRNHVGAIMKRFGVRSQPELLKVLRAGASAA